MNNLKKNLIFLGIFATFFGLSQIANAAYVCEPYYNGSTNCYTNNYSNTVPTGSRIVSDGGGMYYRETNYANINSTQYNSNSNFGAPIASTYGTQYGGTYYDNGSQNNGTGYNGPVNTTNTTNGANSNTTANKSTTTTKTTTNTTNKVATNTNTKNNDANTTTTNVSNDNSSARQESGLSANSLTALSFQGSNSFMPDTVWEWICVFFLLLIIIILIRQFRNRGGHEVHNVAHH